MTNIYTADEIACHNNAKDVWVVVHGNVYDLTSFLDEHPGGEEVLLGLAGQDGTECFDNVGHSEEALQLRKKFKIGEIVGGASAPKPKITKVREPTIMPPKDINDQPSKQQYENSEQDGPSKLMMLIAASIIIYFISYFFNKI